MATNVTMPSMGFDMTEGKVARWLKKIGDAVTRGETIGEIETEKATVDLAAPADGVFAQILVEPGNTVPVNTPIAVIAAPGETLGAPAPQTKAAPETQVAPSTPSASTTAAPAATVATAPKDDGRIKVSPLARNLAKAAGIDLNTLKGTGPGGRIIERDVEQAIAAKKAAPAPAAAPPPAAAPMPTPPPRPSPRVWQERGKR